EPNPQFGHGMRKYFGLDEGWLNLNHGSFGTCPLAVTQVASAYRSLSERRPDTFIRFNVPHLLARSRAAVARVVNCSKESIVYVPNATSGVNTVLRGLSLTPGDRVLYFDFIYGACGNTVLYIAETTGAVAVKIEIRLPANDDDILAAFEKEASKGAKVAVFDTITSLPACRLPFEKLVKRCRELGILSCIDAAHGVGQIPLDLRSLDPDFFTSNIHKWGYAPRGCAMLYVADRCRGMIRSTLPTSWGWEPKAVDGIPTNSMSDKGDEADKWARMWDFVGTIDSSNYLSVPAALAFRERIGGEDKIMRYSNDIAKRGAEILAKKLGTEIMFPSADIAMHNIRLPLSSSEVGSHRGRVASWLLEQMDSFDTFLSIFSYRDEWWVRISGQIYLEEEDFVKGAGVLSKLV
ncbi:putative aminotransferase, partial [Gaertneriomyces semiglobifer]